MTDHPNYTTKTKMRGMLRSPLFRRFLFPIVIVIFAFTGAIYGFSVPYLKKLVYSMEERAVLTNLNNVKELVRGNYLAIDAYKKSILDAHKRQLKNITLFEEAYIKNKFEEYSSGLLMEDEAQWSALEELKEFRYGNDNYVWIADINGVFLSHPDPEMDQRDFSEMRDVFGNYVLSPLIEKVIEKNEGYHSYWWQRLGQDLPAEQLTYARLFPQWGWVIGTGVYLDDLEKEVILRRENMIEELRDILLPIKIADTGFMYIFDSWQNVIIHPNKTLENSNMSSMVNPQTGKPITEALIAASQSKDHILHYKWNRPDDPDNYNYDRISWVQYVEGFDWYIVASVDAEELNARSLELRDKIILISVAIFIVTTLIVTLLVDRLLRPIQALTQTASEVRDGDLTSSCDIKSSDEIGFLATSFNSMVGQLRTNIEELDQKVLERTKELDEKNIRLEDEVIERKKMQEAVVEANDKLTAWVDRLEQHNREITQLNKMGEMLQASHSLDETYPIIAETMATLFPDAKGGLFMVNESTNDLDMVTSWNNFETELTSFPPDACWSIRRNRAHILTYPEQEQVCKHMHVVDDAFFSFCLPLVGQNEILGMLHIAYPQNKDTNEDHLDNRKRLITAVADHLAMAQANLKLRERLHHLSVRDGLTRLFNRRYMEETLIREFKRAERQDSMVGVIMLDVDFFKKFNDTYGHEAGDIVLTSLAKQFLANVRQDDVVCRYGGEEFVIILPGSSLDQTTARAESIRSSVENDMRITYGEHIFKVTISLGASCYPQHGKVPDEVLNAADAALYRSKENGRNQVSAAE